jgi:hypothetical protein
VSDPTTEPERTLAVGDRVRFAPYKRAMTVRAVTTGGRFAILTMPFPPKQTVIYTVIDFKRGVRGCDNHYGLGYETDDQVARALEAFQATEDDLPGQRAREAEASGETSWPSVLAAEVSHRKYVALDIVTVLSSSPREGGV